MASGNGGIIGVSNVVQNGCTATATASGIWQLNTVYDYVKSSDWVYNWGQLDYMVLAGGGSSGGGSGSGGGGGGLLTSFPGGTKVDIREGSATTVTVGLGAAASPSGSGLQGSPSSLSSVCTTGGGYGGTHSTTGGPGGSGGGGTGTGGPGPGIPGQGNPGAGGGGSGGGGGGGAGAGGFSGPGGNGGTGLANLIAPAYPLGTTFAGGGGSHGQPPAGGSGGPGGGGNGIGTGGGGPATPGTDGLGGGAGGGAPGGGPLPGGNGVVFVRIATACKPAAFALAPGCNTSATVGCCTVATFTVTGTLTL